MADVIHVVVLTCYFSAKKKFFFAKKIICFAKITFSPHLYLLRMMRMMGALPKIHTTWWWFGVGLKANKHFFDIFFLDPNNGGFSNPALPPAAPMYFVRVRVRVRVSTMFLGKNKGNPELNKNRVKLKEQGTVQVLLNDHSNSQPWAHFLSCGWWNPIIL